MGDSDASHQPSFGNSFAKLDAQNTRELAHRERYLMLQGVSQHELHCYIRGDYAADNQPFVGEFLQYDPVRQDRRAHSASNQILKRFECVYFHNDIQSAALALRGAVQLPSQSVVPSWQDEWRSQ